MKRFREGMNRVEETLVELVWVFFALVAFFTKHPILLGMVCGVVIGRGIAIIEVLWRKK